jgi:alkylation response protein AidB-like acyl-CoA dehydrogenase
MEGWLWAFADDATEIRRFDFSLSDEQVSLRDRFSAFFTEECPSSVVRAAEPLGFDSALWQKAAERGLPSLRLPEDEGGAGASAVDLTLVAEEAGRVAAPIPFAETPITVPLLALCADDGARSRLDAALNGSYISTLALRALSDASPQLVPAGAIAHGIVALDADELALYEPQTPLPHVHNLGTAPLAWWDSEGIARRVVIASGEQARELHAAAVAQWRLLTAAALIGMATTSVRLAVDFAKTRLTSGVPTGALQAVAHPLVDGEILCVVSRHLIWKAAWFHDNEPESAPELVAMAFVHADGAASQATATALHMQGGLGYTNEGDVTLHLRRIKGYGTLGDPMSAAREVGDALMRATLRPPDTSRAPAGVLAHGL